MEDGMRKIAAIVVLIMAISGSTYAQTTDFFELVKTGTPQAIQAAFDRGADLKAQDKAGATALMYAALKNQNPEVITTLLKAGADAKAKDKAGKTAFDYAQKNEKLKGTDAYWKLSDARY
jgi:ankyrin repeat protein